MGTSKKMVSCLRSYMFLLTLFVSIPISEEIGSKLKRRESIKDGETNNTMISDNGVFELGFFSLLNSTNRFVGIWYHKIPGKTIVWVANRDNPLLDSSGIFKIGDDGNLHVFNGEGKSLWASGNDTLLHTNSVVLRDDGNLVLAKQEEIGAGPTKKHWQSFDHPTNTFLPGMRIWVPKEGNVVTRQGFTSWKSENDPSSGEFTSGMDSLKSPQIVTWKGSKRLWRSGFWNGQIFLGVPSMKPQSIFGFKASPIHQNVTYVMYGHFTLMRFVLQPNGMMVEKQWDEEKKEWVASWEQGTKVCDRYNKCGNYGSCTITSNSDICSCLHGFVPKSNDEWDNQNWTSGCVRRTPLKCEQQKDKKMVVDDVFFKIDGMNLPDLAEVFINISNTNDCQNHCSKNCSCKVFAFHIGVGCLTWGEDLVDIQKLDAGGSDLYLRLANSELGNKRKTSKIRTIFLSVIISIIIIPIVFGCLLWNSRYKIQGLWKKKRTRSLDTSQSRDVLRDLSEDDIGQGEDGNAPDLPLFSFGTIVNATNNFCATNRLGTGGFGHVYKGLLTCGKVVAVKRLSPTSVQGIEQLKNEIILIAKLQHRNLVKILGCCVEGEEKMLLYEYMPNKSLDFFIFGLAKQVLLNWEKRFKIIEGIARGLVYLHRDSRVRVVHRDLKASNVLLDEEMNPKISDFGMAKIFGENQVQANTDRIVGTFGYMSPEYAMKGLFSAKSDVYSFGVLLLEIVSGKKCSHFRDSDIYPNLLGYAWQLWSENKIMEIANQSIRDSCVPSEVARCVQVGLLCVQDIPSDRPVMASVISMLESDNTPLPNPKQPKFLMNMDSPDLISANELTVSALSVR